MPAAAGSAAGDGGVADVVFGADGWTPESAGTALVVADTPLDAAGAASEFAADVAGSAVD